MARIESVITDPPVRARRRLASALLVASLMLGSAWALPSDVDDTLARMPPPVQREVHAHVAAWARMTPAAQAALRARLQVWDALPLAVRRDRREAWQAWQALPADQRLQVRAAALAFAALPPDRQQGLRVQFAQIDISQRRGWYLGPSLGAGFAALQPLLLQVPTDERVPLLAVLRTLDTAQRDALGVLAQRTAPAQRDALRRELISTATANRGAWLQARLDR